MVEITKVIEESILKNYLVDEIVQSQDRIRQNNQEIQKIDLRLSKLI